MVAEYEIQVNQIAQSKLGDMPLVNIPFGKYYTDHMLEADFEENRWSRVEIKPFQPLLMSPSIAAIHYGQSVFEGIKAYRSAGGEVNIFRPQDNFERFNRSAARLCMPAVPKEIFMEGMRMLVDLDRRWVSSRPEHSLYIRPFMFATDEALGVKPSNSYKFMIILSPAGPYYAQPLRIYAEDFYTRAAPGGVGAAKAAGNYAASLLAGAAAREKGFDQVLWMDSSEHKYAQEIGTMNVFFVVGGKLLTPAIGDGTILAGVTRDSAICVLKDMGYEVLEQPVHIDRLTEAYCQGIFTEMFGTGTAATISPIQELFYEGQSMMLNTSETSIARKMKQRLDDIRLGRVEDAHNWLFPV